MQVFNDPAVIERNVKGVLNKFFDAPQLPEKYEKLRNKSYSNNWLILSGQYLHAKNMPTVSVASKFIYYLSVIVLSNV